MLITISLDQLPQTSATSNDGRDFETNSEEEPPPKRRKRSKPSRPSSIDKIGEPFSNQGTSVYKDSTVEVKAKSIAHKRFTRFSVNDHLYNLTIKHLKHAKRPLVMNISKALKMALKNVLDSLKAVYGKDLHHQVYVTIIENKILHGLNSGNYDINTPGIIIANRVLSMLYNYLKSFQTLRINPSFKIQVKVLSVPHMRYLDTPRGQKRVPAYRKRIYRNTGNN